MKTRLHVAQMLKKQGRHISFHTPGHKRAGADITELSYSDNLLNPHGAIKTAQEDIARILGADKSFLLTDGSTSGVFSMLYALRSAGVGRLAFSAYTHASVKNACAVLGIAPVEISVGKERGIPLQPGAAQLKEALAHADALLLTSPDYYGFLAPLQEAQTLCKNVGKPLVVDGAHGAHLHFSEGYAGRYADMWVDGVHKSLPALTQGAVVSATSAWSDYLEEGVKTFRTSSPSYPIMASVEYAVKYPRNEKIEAAAVKIKQELFAVENDDWSKLLIAFGSNCNLAQSFLESRGVYPEFNDGNYLMFYLSPCTKVAHLKRLAALLKKIPRASVEEENAQTGAKGQTRTWVPLERAVGRICAKDCGLFPPCIPLVRAGDVVTEENVKKLSAENTFGLQDRKICVYAEE